MTAAAAPAPAHAGRLRLAGLHLVASLLVLAGAAALLWSWFPGHLFRHDGGWQALRLLAVIHLLLGPLPTLLVATPTKAWAVLKRDLAVIVLVQCCALGAGLWLAWDNRTGALLWLDGTFYVQPHASFADTPEAPVRLAALDDARPPRAMVALPEQAEERARLLRAALARGSSVLFDSSLYQRFEADAPVVQAAADYYLARLPAATRTAIDAHTNLAAAHAAGQLLVPVIARYGTYHVLLERDSGAIVDVIPVRPRTLLYYQDQE